MPFMKEARSLRDAPGGNKTGEIVEMETLVDVVESAKAPNGADWSKVDLADTQGSVMGWVPSDTIDPGNPPPIDIPDEDEFARECWRQAFFFGLNAHYLADQVQAHVASRVGQPAVHLVVEPELLGSAGTLRANRDFRLNPPGEETVPLAVTESTRIDAEEPTDPTETFAYEHLAHLDSVMPNSVGGAHTAGGLIAEIFRISFGHGAR